MKNKVNFTVRLDEDVVKKLLYVAQAEGRNANNHMLHLIRTNIAYHERIHGTIKPKDLENITLEGAESKE